jgi:hypothetical protein
MINVGTLVSNRQPEVDKTNYVYQFATNHTLMNINIENNVVSKARVTQLLSIQSIKQNVARTDQQTVSHINPNGSVAS